MKKIIFDHDFGSDCDDGGAGAMLVKAAQKGLVKILAVTHAVANPYGQYCMEAIFEYLGMKDVPFGYNLENDKFSTDDYHSCTKTAADAYYIKKDRPFPERKSNIKLLRKVLSGNGAKDITLVTTGMLTTIYELCRSGADEISPKTGLELLQENIAEFVLTGANFESEEVREWNVRADIEAGMYTVNEFPMPITYVGSEVGFYIVSGQIFASQPEDYPLREAFYAVNDYNDCTRFSWDQAAMHYAIYGAGDFWQIRGNVGVTLDEEGHTFYREDGKDRYVFFDHAEIDSLRDIFNEEMKAV